MRENIINIKPSVECKRCYETERTGIRSYRQGMVEQFKKDFIKNTKDNINLDYSLDNPKILYLDLMIDNTCNLRCRYCSSVFSSSWSNETASLFKEIPVFKKIMRRPIHMKRLTGLENIESIKNDLRTVEKIYFAGGEPLVNDVHYQILEYLIDNGKTDVEINYSTNFTNIKRVINYWSKFTNLRVGASLDANYKRGEYIRKNLVWNDIVKNRELMIEKLPNVKFSINSTINIFNAYNIVDFHREWIDKKLIGPYDFFIYSIVSNPEHYDIKNLPKHHKDNLSKIYKDHIEYLRTLPSANTNWYFPEFNSNTHPDFTIQSFNGILGRLNLDAEDFTSYWEVDKWLDANRNESFVEIFPEYSDFETFFR
jgi:sulfatase maturation enzyme AslB (radical SAM superfamily)